MAHQTTPVTDVRRPRLSAASFFFIVFALVVIAVTENSDAAGDHPAKYDKWAIVASEPVRQLGIADLLTAELSAVDGVQLVEREELDAVVKELELAAYTGSDASQRLRLGQLLRADALVLLGIVEHDGKRFLKLTVSDCRYGARLHADHFPLAEDKLENAVAQCSAAITMTRERFPNGIQQLIGVTQFVSQDLTHDYDHLQTAYAALVADSLRSHAGTAVIEVEEAHEIRKELSLAGDQLKRRVVPLFVEGKYKVTVGKPDGPPAVEIEVRLTDNQGVRLRIHDEHLAIDEVTALLREDVPQRILQLSETRQPRPLTAARQRELLLARADTFLQLGSHEHSTALREAALLLQADDWQERLALVGDYRRWFEFRKRADQRPHSTDRAVIRQLHAERMAIVYKMLPHVEMLIRHRQLNLNEAVELAQMACVGTARLSLAGENEYGGEAKQVADAFFWKVFPAIPSLDASLRRGSLHPALQKMLGRPVSASSQLPRERQLREWNATAIDYILAHSPRASATGRSLSYGDYSRTLDDLYRYLTRTSPQEWPTRPVGILVVSNLNRLIQTGCLTQGSVREFYLRLMNSGSPLNAFYARCGLLSLDLNVSQDAKIESSKLKEIDSLLEYVQGFAADEVYRRGTVKYLTQLLGRMRSDIVRRIDGTAGRKRHRLPENPIPAIASEPRLTFEPIPSVKSLWHGIIKCTDSLDVMWSYDSVFVMKEPGTLAKIMEVELGSNYYRPLDEVFSAHWDGQNIWVATMNSGVIVLSPAGKILGRIKSEQGLPTFDPRPLVQQTRGYRRLAHNYGLQLHPISPGRCLAIGQYGKEKRVWIALLSRGESDRDAAYRAELIHTATKDLRDLAAAQEDSEALFTPTWLLEYEPPGAGRQTLLVGRQFGGVRQPPSRPLAIDLETLEVSVFPTPFPTPFDTELRARFVVGNSLVFAGKHQIDVFSPPGDEGQEWTSQNILQRPNLSSSPRQFYLVQHQGDLYNPGQLWTRIDGKSWEAEPLNTTPLLSQYRFEHYGVSAHYGFIAWNAGDHPYQVSLDAAAPPSKNSDVLHPHVAPQQREKHHRAVLAIRELGGSVDARWGSSKHTNNSRHPHWRTLVYLSQDWQGGDQGLSHLQDLQGPLELALVRANVSNQGMPLIGSLTALDSLELVETQVTDEGLSELPKLKNLIHCRLEGTAGGKEFTDRALDYLGGMKSLRKVTLYGKGFTDAGLQNFRNPRNIYELHLYETSFTGSGLAQLGKVKRGIRIYENGSHQVFVPPTSSNRTKQRN